MGQQFNKMDDQINLLLKRIKKGKTQAKQAATSSVDIPEKIEEPKPATSTSVDHSLPIISQQKVVAQPQPPVLPSTTPAVEPRKLFPFPVISTQLKPTIGTSLFNFPPQPPAINKEVRGDMQVRAPAHIKTKNPGPSMAPSNDMTVKLSEGALLNIKHAKQKRQNEQKQLRQKGLERHKEKQKEKRLEIEAVKEKEKELEKEKQKQRQKQKQKQGEVVDSKPDQGKVKSLTEPVINSKVDEVEEGEVEQPKDKSVVTALIDNTADTIQKESNGEQSLFVASEFNQNPLPPPEQTKPPSSDQLFPNLQFLKPNLVPNILPSHPPTNPPLFPSLTIQPPPSLSAPPLPKPKPAPIKHTIKHKIDEKSIYRLKRIALDLQSCYQNLSLVAEMKRNNQLTPEMTKKLEVIKLALS